MKAADNRDLWAAWPDDFMCPLNEVERYLNPPLARSDDYLVVEVLEYHEDTMEPSRWVVAI